MKTCRAEFLKQGQADAYTTERTEGNGGKGSNLVAVLPHCN